MAGLSVRVIETYIIFFHKVSPSQHDLRVFEPAVLETVKWVASLAGSTLRGRTPIMAPDNSYSAVEPTPEEEATYADDTPLTWVFGAHPEVKVLAGFLSEPDTLLDKTGIADLAAVSRPSVPSYLESMVECGVIRIAARSGKRDLYQLGDTEAVSLLRELEGMLLSRTYEEADALPTGEVQANPPADREIVEPYAEDTPLTWIFGAHPEAKLIAALLSEPNHTLSVQDWATVAGLSRGAVNNHREHLVKYGVVEDVGSSGRKHLYQLADSALTEQLATLEAQLLRDWYELQGR